MCPDQAQIIHTISNNYIQYIYKKSSNVANRYNASMVIGGQFKTIKQEKLLCTKSVSSNKLNEVATRYTNCPLACKF